MKRIVLSTTGSLGDVHPYLAVGLGLKARNYDVTIATSEYYRLKVEGEGLSFAPIRPDFVPMTAPPEIVRQSFDPQTGANFVLQKLVLPHIEESYEDLLRICSGFDLIVIHPTLFAAPLVVEKLRIKWMSALLSPAVFVSAYDPPIFPPVPWLHPLRHLGAWPHKLIVRAMKVLTRSWTKSIAELRAREGLRASQGSPMHDEMFSPYGTMGWFSHLLAARQPDWPPNTGITGFPFYDRREPGNNLDPALEDFLRGGEPPVVFTLGSSAVVDAGNFYEESLEAVRLLGCRAVLLTGDRIKPDKCGAGNGVFVADYAPYSDLFQRAAAIVHQGGIGTVGQTMRAGVPTLVVPLGLDQPDNAYRLKRLGIARILPRERYKAAPAAAEISKLIGEAKYGSAARSVAGIVQEEDGVAAACATIAKVCAG
jgi:rhamnosyltransferase subunit B